MMYRIIIFTLTFILCDAADLINLPSGFNGKAIYHVKSWQINSWSCGYNVLFNACNLEKALKINSFLSFDSFKNMTLDYIKSKNKKTSDSASNKMLDKLSAIIGLEKSQFLVIKKNEIKPFFSTSIHISYHGHKTQDQINELFEQALMKREKACLIDLKKYFDNISSSESLKFLHLYCKIKDDGINHLVLMSVVQDSNKIRSVFIFDNCNIIIKENSDLKKHLDFICQNFDISKVDEKIYKKIKNIIPTKWQGLPKDSHCNKPK